MDGGWKIVSTFTEWSVCSKTCNGGTRQRTRIRSCTEPMPQYGGKSCVGSTIETETESCNTFKCPSKLFEDFSSSNVFRWGINLIKQTDITRTL